MTQILNKQELHLLRTIQSDKYAIGPFTGMIFNAWQDAKHKQISTETTQLIKDALHVRLLIDEMCKEDIVTKEKQSELDKLKPKAQPKQTQSVMTGQGPDDMVPQDDDDEF